MEPTDPSRPELAASSPESNNSSTKPVVSTGFSEGQAKSVQASYSVALVGNPNTGKSTLFNALTGLRQRIGNYPGVTVEKKNGKFSQNGVVWDVIDLPGTYSLAPRSPDERVTLDVLLGQVLGVQPIDLVICVVDASNLRRNLYLASQVLELGLPTIIALTMVDVAEGREDRVNVAILSERLGVPVIPVHAAQRIGLSKLKLAMHSRLRPADVVQASVPVVAAPTVPIAESKSPHPFHSPLAPEVYAAVRRATAAPAASAPSIGLPDALPDVEPTSCSEQLTAQQWIFLRYLLDPADEQETAGRKPTAFAPRPAQSQLDAVRAELAQQRIDWKTIESQSRYAWIDAQLPSVLTSAPDDQRSSATSWSDRIDSLLTDRIWGSLSFVVMMFVLFTAVFQVAGPFSEILEWAIDGLKTVVVWAIPPGMFRSLLTQGVLDGVGGVLVFLPQIFVLFFFIGLLEDSGYLARSAFLMDRWMSPLGLSGKSFIPLLSSFACAVPGIMGTRVIDRPRDRLLTIMIAPLMSCSARLPVYIVFTQAFIPERFFLGFVSQRALVFISMYLVGVVVAAAIAFVCKRFFWREKSGDFFLELPSYKWPSFRLVVYRMWERGREFIKRAGTVILAMTIIIWAANYFPRNDALVSQQLAEQTRLLSSIEQRHSELSQQEETTEPASLKSAPEQSDNDEPLAGDPQLLALENQLAEVRNQIGAIRQENSYLGQAGKWIEPVVRPLGWDWKIGCAVLASFPAREVVVATLGVLYRVGEADEESVELQNALQAETWADSGEPIFNIPVALSVMVFFALCSQCASTLAVIYHETHSWFWPVVSFVYMTILAYVGAFIVYQVGMWFA